MQCVWKVDMPRKRPKPASQPGMIISPILGIHYKPSNVRGIKRLISDVWRLAARGFLVIVVVTIFSLSRV